MRLQDVILRDTRAAQPLATAVPAGTLYWVTDETILERSNGTTWQSFSTAALTGINQLTGDVTAGPGTGSQVATIANLAVSTGKIAANAVTDAKLRQSAGLSVIGRAANSAGDVADIAAVTDGHLLRLSGVTIAF